MEFNQINLTTHDHIDRRVIYAMLGSAIVLLSFFTLFNMFNGLSAFQEGRSYSDKIDELRQQAKSLVNPNQDDSGYDKKEAEAIQNRNRNANFLIALDIFPWVAILDELEKAIPPQIVLDRFMPKEDLKSIRITGHTTTVESITKFQNALESSAFFQSVVLENMDFGAGKSKPGGSAAANGIHFELICGLNLKAIFPKDQYSEFWMTLTETPTKTNR